MTHQTPAPEAGPADLASLPPMIGVPALARMLGISRASAYRLAAQDALPVPVIRIGHSIRIPTTPLLAALGLTPAPEPPNPVDDGADTAGDRDGTGAGGTAPGAPGGGRSRCLTRPLPTPRGRAVIAKPRPADSGRDRQTITGSAPGA